MDEIKVGKFYELIVTTPSGLMSYPTGDLLEVVQENPLQVRVAGRIKDTLRIVGEWTGVDSVRRALAEASMKQGIRYQNFIVTPTVTNGEKPGYHCYVEFDQNKLPKESQKFAIDFDEALKRIDYSYQEMRRINALGIPQLSHVRAGTLDHILLEGKHCGQGKYLHLYSSRSILDKIPEKEIS